MALSNSQHDHFMRLYEQRQLDNENRLRSRFEEVYQKLPQIRDLDNQISALSLEKAKKLLSGDESALLSF